MSDAPASPLLDHFAALDDPRVECTRRHALLDHADQNFAILRRLALNLLRQETTAKMGVKAKSLKAGWDAAYLRKILDQ